MKQTIQEREQETYKYIHEWKRISKILDKFFEEVPDILDKKSMPKAYEKYEKVREKTLKKILVK